MGVLPLAGPRLLRRHFFQDKKRGMRILRHLYRTRLLVYVIDVARGRSLRYDRWGSCERGEAGSSSGAQGEGEEDEEEEEDSAGVTTGLGDPFEDFLFLREEVMKHSPVNEEKKELVRPSPLARKAS